MNVLGLDLSLTSTGYAIDRPTQLHVGRLTNNLTGPERLNWIAHEVVALAEQADLTAIEGYAFARPNQAHQVGELGGTVRLELWRRNLPYVEVPPSTVKKYATGRGNADKETVLAECIRRLGYMGSSTDEADALWVRAVVLEAAGCPPVEMPQGHVEAIHATGSGRKKHPPLTAKVAAVLADGATV